MCPCCLRQPPSASPPKNPPCVNSLVTLVCGMRRFARALFITLLAAAMPTRSEAFSVSEWEQVRQEFREGYVLAVMEFVSIFASAEDQSKIETAIAYQKCFRENKFNSTSATKLVDRYILRNTDASTQPMIVNVTTAFSEACKGYFPEGKF